MEGFASMYFRPHPNPPPNSESLGEGREGVVANNMFVIISLPNHGAFALPHYIDLFR